MANKKNILIRNGILVSKEFNQSRKDILLKDNRIFDIQDKIEPNNNWELVDAGGKIVSPGFISIHSHNDFYLPLDSNPSILKSLLFQGITTSVGGNCGISNYPISSGRLEDIESYQGFLHYEVPEYNWSSLKEYLNYIKGKIVLNFIPLVGHGTLRVICNGFGKNISSEKMKNLRAMLRETLEQGSFGMSTGLMYMPGTFSTTNEIIELVKELKKYPNTIYSSHLRGYSDTYIESVKEAIEIGEKTGITVQCSHLGPFGIKFGPQILEVLDLMEAARKKGVSVGYDSLAYCGGSTTIMALLPPWSYQNGLDKFLLDIRDDGFFNKVINYIENYIPKWPSWEGSGWTDNFVKSLGWENLFVLSSGDKNFMGKNFIQIAEEKGISKHQAFRDVLIREKGIAIMYMAGVGSCIDDRGDMGYFDSMVENPLCVITVDALFSKKGRTMPYAYGTFPRIINRYVKQKKSITLKEAVEKFTSRVVEKFNITDRGYLRKGAFADIVIFDLDKMKDYPDIFAEKPLLSTGVEYLLINGYLVIKNGKYNTKNLPGEIISNN